MLRLRKSLPGIRGSKMFAAALLLLPGSLAAQDSVPVSTLYPATGAMLTRLIEHEVAGKHLPALSIALVDQQNIVWARGFGFANVDDSLRATARSVYRVGPVSQLFTDIAILRQVERGRIDLDRAVTVYLPGFHPSGRGAAAISLRQLMAHESGLVREPPMGDRSTGHPVSLDSIVAALNATAVAFPPGTRIKYSEAGTLVAGAALERVTGEPLDQLVNRDLLLALGMSQSSLLPPDSGAGDIPGVIPTADGRRLPAPRFEPGALSTMYSTAFDLGRLVGALLAGGQGPGQRILRTGSVSEMWRSQGAGDGRGVGYGLGFSLDRLAGERRARQGGTLYGTTAEIEALPDRKLGVVVITSLGGANAVVKRIAEAALEAMLAEQDGHAISEPVVTVPAEQVREMTGFYQSGREMLELRERLGGLELLREGQAPLAIRRRADTLIVDDAREFGVRLLPRGRNLLVNGRVYTRTVPPLPAAAPSRWQGLIGEYGWDDKTLYILEDRGKLFALTDWFFPYALTEGADSHFAFPDSGRYAGERVTFFRDPRGRARRVVVGGVVYPRRSIGPEDGTQLKIKPVRPVNDLIQEALSAVPPTQPAGLRAPDLVELAKLDSTLRLEIRYATTNNFAGTVFYAEARAFMQRPAAEALLRVQRWLRPQGYGLLIHDAYRPWYVTKAFWDAVPDSLHWLVANPASGSRHNRGEAVDLTLYDLVSGRPVEMPGTYDESTPRSYSDYPGGTSRERWHRELLRRAMEREGFTVNPEEWWHFDFKDWREYPVLNLRFDQLTN